MRMAARMLQESMMGALEVARESKSQIHMGPSCWALLGFLECLGPTSPPSSLAKDSTEGTGQTPDPDQRWQEDRLGALGTAL